MSEAAQAAINASSPLIGESTGVTIGVVLGVMTTMVGGALWISSGLNKVTNGLEVLGVSVNSRIDSLTAEVNARLHAIEDKAGGRVTRAEMRAWIQETRALNPNCKIPDLPQ